MAVLTVHPTPANRTMASEAKMTMSTFSSCSTDEIINVLVRWNEGKVRTNKRQE
jgi:hypothetical protein